MGKRQSTLLRFSTPGPVFTSMTSPWRHASGWTTRKRHFTSSLPRAVQVYTKKPWRQTLGWGNSVRNELLSEVIKRLRPRTNLQVPSFNILLAGQIGSGKSSFINSTNGLFKGHVCVANAATGKMAASVTKEFYMYEIRPTLRIYDTVGIEPEAREMDVRNVLQAVEGHVPHEHTYIPGKEFHYGCPGYIANPTFAERAHCVAMVINAQNASYMRIKMKEKLQSLADGVRSRKIPLFIILTHLDELRNEKQKDATMMYRSIDVENIVRKISKTVDGVAENQIFPVINNTKRVEPDDNMDVLILYALRQMLREAQDHLKNLERDREFTLRQKLLDPHFQR